MSRPHRQSSSNMPHSSTLPYPTTSSSSSHHRYPATQSTSSAFSASANPNEDWTKISDLAERRRIQNRIAQRNYRKKLKKRLEDLERRATSSASPEPKDEQDESPSRQNQDYSYDSKPQSFQVDATASMMGSQNYSSPSYPSQSQQPRQRSPSPPSAYTAYPTAYSGAPEYSTYPSTSSYSQFPSLSNDLSAYSSYPSTAQRNNVDRRTAKPETFDEQMRSFNLNYSPPPAIYDQYPQTHRPSWHDVTGPQDLHTPPLSDTDLEICPPLDEIEIDEGLFEMQPSSNDYLGFQPSSHQEQQHHPLTPPMEEQPPFFFL